MEFWVSLILAGIGTGCIYSLAGMGIVLTYKATGIFNFAHGAIAMFVAYILWQLNSEWHISLAIAAPVTLLIVGPGIGLILERFIFRPLQRRGAGTSEKLVANLGVENVGIDDAGNPVAEPVTVRLTFFDPATGEPAGDPIKQPVQVRWVDDCPGDVRPAVVGEDRHSVESGRVTRPELSLDHDAVAVR